MISENPELALEQINHTLSELLQREPLVLSTGGTAALQDPLWVWGVLGGKNVGKSSLINALAGSPIVQLGALASEGTAQPAVYVTPDDLGALQSRFADLPELDIRYLSNAPACMSRLALVDLPDFDSLFDDHAEQVRLISSHLDGIIWVTTPKKVSDLAGLAQIRQVLKDRVNFVYVVNKVDWLLDQSPHAPSQDLERLAAALTQQVAADGAINGDARLFLISARYPTAQAMLENIAHVRHLPEARLLSDARLHDAARRAEGDFGRLRATLTTPPSPDAARANKSANLKYQLQHQSRQLADHYQAAEVLDRLDRSLGEQTQERMIERAFDPAYCDHLCRTLNDEQVLNRRFAAELLKRRLSAWSLLGIVAWPIVLLASVLQQLRGSREAPGADDWMFRFDGLTLEQRVEGLLAAARSVLSRVHAPLSAQLPPAAPIAATVERHAHLLADQAQAAALAPYLKTPGVVGRSVRLVLPLVILLWFPLIQPVLAAILPLLGSTSVSRPDPVVLVVEVLSAASVLTGLSAALLILAILAAAIYTRAVHDAYRATQRLAVGNLADVAAVLLQSVRCEVFAPLARFREQLADCVDRLQVLDPS